MDYFCTSFLLNQVWRQGRGRWGFRRVRGPVDKWEYSSAGTVSKRRERTVPVCGIQFIAAAAAHRLALLETVGFRRERRPLRLHLSRHLYRGDETLVEYAGFRRECVYPEKSQGYGMFSYCALDPRRRGAKSTEFP